MNISLDLIKPSPKPIRTTWDEDKLGELAQSIKYMGLVAPIKVRPTQDLPDCDHHGLRWIEEVQGSHQHQGLCNHCEHYRGKYAIYMDWEIEEDPDVQENIDDAHKKYGELFEIVYGHRRVAALQIAGLTETDAIVEGMGDTDALIQSLIENVQREDMEPIDTAKALERLIKKTGWNPSEIERRGILPKTTINDLLRILKLPEEIQQIITRAEDHRTPEGKITVEHVSKVSNLDVGHRQSVLEKAADEGLSTRQTRKVAESVAATKDPKKREYLLNTEFSSFIHDPEIVAFEESIPKEKSKPDLGSAFDPTPEVGWILEYLSAWTKKVDKFVDATEAGKFSPEAQAFTARRAQKFVNKLSDWIEILEGEDV